MTTQSNPSVKERMARAAFEDTAKWRGGEASWDGIDEELRAAWYRLIDAILEVLRTPTEGMLEAAGESEGAKRINGLISFAWAHDIKLSPDEPAPLVSIHEAMIDHILKGGS